MQIPIPSWSVAVIGSLLVVASTAVGTLLIRDNNSLVDANQTRAAELMERFQTTWDGHKLAENRFAAAEFLAGMVAQATDDGTRNFLLPRSAKYLKDAVYTMRLSYFTSDESQQPESEMFEPSCEALKKNENMEHIVNTLTTRLGNQDLGAYDELVSVLDTERLFSACALRKLRNDIGNLESERERIESDNKFLQGVQISLNLLGLVIVLLKLRFTNLALRMANSTRPKAGTIFDLANLRRSKLFTLRTFPGMRRDRLGSRIQPPLSARHLPCEMLGNDTAVSLLSEMFVNDAPTSRFLVQLQRADLGSRRYVRTRDYIHRTGRCMRYSLQGRDIPKSAIDHTCEHMRSHAPRLNPLACGFLV